MKINSGQKEDFLWLDIVPFPTVILCSASIDFHRVLYESHDHPIPISLIKRYFIFPLYTFEKCNIHFIMSKMDLIHL